MRRPGEGARPGGAGSTGGALARGAASCSGRGTSLRRAGERGAGPRSRAPGDLHPRRVPPLDETDGPPALRRSASGRVPQWALDEAVGRSVDVPAWRTPPVGTPRPGRRRRRAASVGLVALLLVGFAAAERTGVLGDVTSTAGPVLAGGVPAGQEEEGRALGTPEAVTVRSDRWAPLDSRLGQPVRWDPCRPVHFVVNPDGMPAGGRPVLDAAIARVARATGLRFVDDGATTETDRTAPVDAGRYGRRWAPVLVRWNLPAEHGTGEDGVEGDVVGRAGPFAVSTPTGGQVYVSGTVGLTTDGAALDPTTTWGAAAMEAVWLHEWAHLVGLGHVEDPTQLMNPSVSGVLDYAAGDLTGLAEMGSGPCVPTV